VLRFLLPPRVPLLECAVGQRLVAGLAWTLLRPDGEGLLVADDLLFHGEQLMPSASCESEGLVDLGMVVAAAAVMQSAPNDNHIRVNVSTLFLRMRSTSCCCAPLPISWSASSDRPAAEEAMDQPQCANF
jgi:hypothetical protein